MTPWPRRTFVRLASLTALALTFGCAPSREAAPHGTSYVPLDQGHRLHYRMRVDRSTVILIQEIRGTEVRDGHTYAVQLTSTADGVIRNDPLWLREDDTGVYSRDPKESEEVLMVPAHPVVGNEWTTITDKYVVHRVIEDIADLDVEGRTYRGCVEVVYHDQTPDGRDKGRGHAYWFAPGVGLIGVGRETPNDPWLEWIVRHAK